jgi:uncharacterized protein DUF4240
MNSDKPFLDESATDFWELVALSQQDREDFRARVKKMSREELSDFYWTYENAAAELKAEPYVDAMQPGLSESGIDDLAIWIVSQGKDYYEKVLNDPKQTPAVAGPSSRILDNVIKEYYDRFGGSIPFPKN